jgi:hypothetical protein
VNQLTQDILLNFNIKGVLATDIHGFSQNEEDTGFKIQDENNILHPVSCIFSFISVYPCESVAKIPDYDIEYFVFLEVRSWLKKWEIKDQR